MEVLHYVIALDPRTKKNHQTIAGSGQRCPVCKKYERQFVRQSKAHDRYQAMAVMLLTPRPKQPVSVPVHVKYHFYMQTRRKVDKTNLVSAADDLLVDARILADDNAKILIHHDGTRVFYDKRNPRTEIWIYPYKEEEDVETADVQSGQIPGAE